ncbi:MAG: peptidoglycan-binding protein [Candidatus Tagabacteria bacterium]
MKNFKKFTFLAVFLAILVAMPNFVPMARAASLTQSQINAIVSLLQSFGADQTTIGNVQTALGGAPTSPATTAWCHDFSTNLEIDDSGSEVAALQTALGKESFNIVNYQNGNFNEGTASAVTGFQQKYKDEILTPLGLKYGTGYVGIATRTKLNKLYGCKVISNNYSCKQVLYNGDPKGKINLFFISDGFSNSNIDIFEKNVNWALNLNGISHGLFSKTPYKENKNMFNAYKISSENIFDCLLTHNSGPAALPCDTNNILNIPVEFCGISKIDQVILVGYPYSANSENRSGIWSNENLSVLLSNLTDESVIQGSINHEVGGHGIGGLGDEYYSSNQYKESWNMWPNVDQIGCPKWCSGKINTNVACYQTYLEWNECVQSYLDQICKNGDEEYKCGISESIKKCHDDVYQKEIDAGRFLPNCDLGLSCLQGTGCYWGAGYSLANFRSVKDGIMYASYVDGIYGPVGEREITKRIKSTSTSTITQSPQPIPSASENFTFEQMANILQSVKSTINELTRFTK